MRIITVTALFVSLAIFNCSAYAATDARCSPAVKEKAILLENQMVKTAVSVVKNRDGSDAVTEIGSGTGYVLYSVFVASAKTADNTHWEIVEKFDSASGLCEFLSATRFEAP